MADYRVPTPDQRATEAEEAKRRERIERFDPSQRFRPYRVERGPYRQPVGRQEWLAGAGCPTWGGIVPMLVWLHDEGEYATTDRIGVLDTAGWRRGNPATWVINPYED